jgi:hypothetical protein
MGWMLTEWPPAVFQVDELDLTKPKATELLKSHEGDVLKALRAFVNTRA